MRNIYAPILALLLILGFSLWCAHYTEEQTDQWTQLLQESIEAGREQDWDKAEARLSAAHRSWDRSQTIYHIIMDHDELEAAESLFTGAMDACEEQSFAAYRILVDALSSQLKVLSEYQAISIKNVL